VSGVDTCTNSICTSTGDLYQYRFQGGQWQAFCPTSSCPTLSQGGTTTSFSDGWINVPQASTELQSRFGSQVTAGSGFAGSSEIGGGAERIFPSATEVPAPGTRAVLEDTGAEALAQATEVPAPETRAVLEDTGAEALAQKTPAELLIEQNKVLEGLSGRHVIIEGESGILKQNAADGTWSLYGSDGKACTAYCGPDALTTPDVFIKGGAEGSFNWGQFRGELLSNLGHALLIYGVIQLFGPILGLETEETKALSEAAALGYLVGSTINSAAADPEAWKLLQGKGYGTGIGIGVAVIYFLHEYRKEDSRIIQFSCSPWQPTTSGENCEDCNTRGLPCSEYQCKSLGQGCELVNKGTMEEACVWINRNDVNPPIMEPWEGALLNDYEYTPNNAIAPPDRGVNVNYQLSNDNCAPAFTPLQFGVILDEPAKCKVDVLRKENYKEMDFFISEGLLRYNHTFTLSLPGASNLEGEGIEVANDGNYQVYMGCEDSNGNSNVANFVFNYCIDKGPDTTPPLIIGTNPINGNPVQFDIGTYPNAEFYLNEPAECKWSNNDRDYSNMENSMSCGTTIGSASQGIYTCGTDLTGLKNREDNEFFVRCKDQPVGVEETSRNVNVQSYRYVLKGTQPLVIDSVSPNDELVKDAANVVKVTFKVETSAGYQNGEATCYYSRTGGDDYIEFFKTNSHTHSQDLFLPQDSYNYFIQCRDLGGNTDTKEINFDVESDNSPPRVVRAYHEETYLKLITNEEARCVYDVVDCSYDFDDGIVLTSSNDFDHFVNWDVKSSLYVKCRDEFGNQPSPNQCSIIARSTDF
jgi:hypothetical protein